MFRRASHKPKLNYSASPRSVALQTSMNVMEPIRATRMLTVQTHKGPTAVCAALDTKETGCHAEVRTKDSFLECGSLPIALTLSNLVLLL